MYEAYQDPWEQEGEGSAEAMSQQDRQRAGGVGGFVGGLVKSYLSSGALGTIGQGDALGSAGTAASNAAVSDWGSGGLDIGGTQVGGAQAGDISPRTFGKEQQGFIALLKSLFGTPKGPGTKGGPWGAYGMEDS